MAKESALWLVLVMGTGVANGEETRTFETIHLVWLDPHGLFYDFERARDEADTIFRDLGVSVRWEVGTDPRPSTGGEVRVQAVLMLSEPSGWGIAPTAMGVVLLPDRSRPESVFLFYPAILRSVGLAHRKGSMLSPSERKDLARAVGRVLVHEIVHAIAPTLTHADEGLMHDALLSASLLKSRIEIDERTRRAFRKAAETE
ncbi:MAG TPA: hypothetical protein VLK65_00755 [Vicinamibacteria bacterium]|nr:hypothetical protein [Vicinamibacteria bacterium]